jgi:TonB family protein
MLFLAVLWVFSLQAASTPAATVPCDRDVMVTHQTSPGYPESARELGLTQVTAGIQVYITPQGTIAALRVINSSGNGDLDQAAIRAAAESTYLPRVKNCKPAFGLYLFKVTFDPNQ